MNEVRQLYLNMYFNNDFIYHLIQNLKMHFHTRKYWHSPMTHVKLLAIVVEYDIYLECADGELNES